MELVIWIGVMIAIGIAIWLAAPHHEKLVRDRTLPSKQEPPWD